ncbi:hypothetical protein ACFDR9_004065 [Janthinobacterium sp. CG_23.3]|uniref:hypothetical protein n=1 Tax=Janthinobacterium sp. CG_23.3 TaxID=3349634 RepID=UPI0038D43C83
MADHEIAKPTKNVYNLFTPKERSLWHKAREIGQEILIIVVAVSASIWLYSIAAHRQEQQQVQSFLLGLKSDLQGDLVRLNEVIAGKRAVDANYQYLAALDANDAPAKARLDAAMALTAGDIAFSPQLGRYEGFKSSGKLMNIDNEALLEKILALYQHKLPQIQSAEGGWNSVERHFLDYMDDGVDAAAGADTRLKLLTAAKGRRLLARMAQLNQRYDSYQAYAALGKLIINDIEQAYPGAKGTPSR